MWESLKFLVTVIAIMVAKGAFADDPKKSLGVLPTSGIKSNAPSAQAAASEEIMSPYGPSWFDGKRLGTISQDFKSRVKPSDYLEFSGAFNLVEPIYRRLRIFFGVGSAFLVTADEIKDQETKMLLQLDLSKIPAKYMTKLKDALGDITTAPFVLKDFWRDVFFDASNPFRVRMVANLQGTQKSFGNYRTWERFFVKASDSKAVVLSLGGDTERWDRVIYRRQDGKASVAEDFDNSGRLVRREVMEVLNDNRTNDFYLTAFRQDISGDQEKLPDPKQAKRSFCLACHQLSLKAFETPKPTTLFDLAHLNPNTYSNLNSYHSAPPTGHVFQKVPGAAKEALSKQLPQIKPLK